MSNFPLHTHTSIYNHSDHDLIGRVSVDVTNFYPDTEYLLTYNIYPTGKFFDFCSNFVLPINLHQR